MIDLFSANTPNGWKISIMLEEIGFDYNVIKVDLAKDEQFNPDFKKISPFGKIPVIIDHDNKKSIFESGAILIYLADKSNKLYDQKADYIRMNPVASGYVTDEQAWKYSSACFDSPLKLEDGLLAWGQDDNSHSAQPSDWE